MTYLVQRLINVLLISIVLLIMAGCNERYVRVYDRYPYYELPSKAHIDKISKENLDVLNKETYNKIINTIKELKQESAQLRVILESYNKYAEEKNAEYDKIFQDMDDHKIDPLINN